MMDQEEDLERAMDMIARQGDEFRLLKTDTEARLRVLEAFESEDLRKSVTDLDVRMRALESDSDKRKQNLSTVMNFVVQLVWVCMAAYLLMKLGLDAPL